MIDRFVEVVLPLPLPHPLIYRLPASLSLSDRPLAGHRVKVPLGSRSLIGCLLREQKEKPAFPTKEILDLVDDQPILSATALKLLTWTSAYYLTPIGEVLRHLLPPGLLRGVQKTGRGGPPWPSSIKGQPQRVAPTNSDQHPLNVEQHQALEAILEEFHKERPSPVLLQGITGSGKTEVYIEAIRHRLKEGGQALVLVPEIGLTPQLVDRFCKGLPEIPILFSHSGMTPSARREVWLEVWRGATVVVIATRSGIFLPFLNLKTIVVDEEHDSSFKQEERFCYHARDLALWRGEEEKILVLMGSATPSLEILYRTRQEKVRLLRLTERAAGASPPRIEMIDRRNRSGKKEGHPFLSERLVSERLVEEIRENLKRREQTLLFLNRRGFSPFVVCVGCGFVPRCQACDISLTLHREKKDRESGPRLLCHYCDAVQPYHPLCPKCPQGTMRPQGFGTERIDSELRSLFPSSRIARLDRDTAGKKGWLKILDQMRKKEIDILVGTQMITKGHDYPDLTLVGILDADLSLRMPDFRASERTYQLITQVAGRAGRGEKPGRVLVQTWQPEERILTAAANADGDRFYDSELRQRQEAGYPPFRRLVEIRLAGIQRPVVVEKIRSLFRRLEKGLPPAEVTLLGPAPCPIERVRGKARWRLLLKTARYARIQPRLRILLDEFAEKELPSNMKMLVNVDPVNMM